ncbi:MAG TPA: ABC transporter permease [Myxococcales bacterium]|nr:ABC transporter permease [Myxococcales bacterium]
MLRLFLRAYPKAFRQKHGEEILALCRDQYGPGFSLRAAADLLWSGLCERAGSAPASLEDWMERPRKSGARGERLASIARDVRSGVRSLRHSGGFTPAIVLTLALGIGATTAIFSMVDAVLLRPLPYANGERLLRLTQPASGAKVENAGFSPLEVADVRAQTRTLDAVVEYHGMQFTLLGGPDPQRVATGVVSWNFFDAFGVKPLVGRTFLPSDEEPGAPAVLVLSYGYWMRAYRGDAAIVGRTFTMNDKTHTVIGVLPPIPQHPAENDVYMPTTACPFRSGAHWQHDRGMRGLSVYARMKPGVQVETARAEVASIMARMREANPQAYPRDIGFGSGAALLRDELSKPARPTLLLLLATAAFLLIIVCSNVANLTLARLVRREREMAVRAALGASRGRLFQQLLVEGLLLAVAGGLAGVAVAALGLDALVAFAARFTARAGEIHLDGRVLLFALGVSLATGIVLGCLPALPARADLAAALKDGNVATAHRSRMRARSALIVAQVAVSFSLLCGAGLMLRSLVKLQQVDAGFDPQNVFLARVDLIWGKYDTVPKRAAFVRQLLERVRAEPGVVAAGIGGTTPLRDNDPNVSNFQIEGAVASEGQVPRAEINMASPGYFRAMGVPLLAGRDFEDADLGQSEPTVVMVNQSFARHWFPRGDALGKRISVDKGRRWLGIVGIAADVKQHGLSVEPPDEIYGTAGDWGDLRLAVRGRAAGMEHAVREIVRAIDPDQPVTDVSTLLEVRSEALAPPRLTALLLGAFALLALCITAAGIGGVIAYSVSQRTHEIGIRMALGAQRAEVLGMVLRQGMGLVALGLAIGAFGGITISRAMQGLVFGVAASDPITFAAGAGLLAGVGALACLMPARRAANVDPLVALRST